MSQCACVTAYYRYLRHGPPSDALIVRHRLPQEHDEAAAIQQRGADVPQEMRGQGEVVQTETPDTATETPSTPAGTRNTPD